MYVQKQILLEISQRRLTLEQSKLNHMVELALSERRSLVDGNIVAQSQKVDVLLNTFRRLSPQRAG